MPDENALSLVQSNEELLKLYGESAQLGSQNLVGSVPMLKVHTVNKSEGNVLVNGSEPNDGWFFLTGNQEQFQNPICHILYISKGFRAEGMIDKVTGNKQDDKFNQILGGVIVDGTDYKPFVMYFTGIKLQKLWDFGKEVNKFTHAKPVGIPMFALTVKLSTIKVKHNYGSSYAIDFSIVKKGDFPALVTDPGQFVFLRDMTTQVGETIENLISIKSTSGTDKPDIDQDVKNAEQVFIYDDNGDRQTRKMNPPSHIEDEIPF